ncbi:MAG: hypothetical protein CL609_21175 [Anaerolineaceae bacterium]|nr:hypothetical protein [Anaerolineaceae bacterium]
MVKADRDEFFKKGEYNDQEKIQYFEGSWFAVPLRDYGYGMGIIVRGAFKTKGGLGYFFGPRYTELPTGIDTLEKNKSNAILVCMFGDLGIINGTWPLISEGKAFSRQDWPVPLFLRNPPYPEDLAYIVDYGQDYSGSGNPISEKKVNIDEEILKIPKDSLFGCRAVEIALAKKLITGIK